MELVGVFTAMASSALGGTAVGATRFLAGALDPLTIGALRFAGGFVLLAAVAALRRDPWPARRDWPAAIGLGLLFFAAFPALFNASLIFTSASRGALALSTLPLLTIAVGAALGVEAPTWRKTAGVLIATSGVAFSLGASVSDAPAGAWRGDLLMVAGALCMAFYGVWSRPLIARSAPLSFAATGMGVGALALCLMSAVFGRPARLVELAPIQWFAIGYLAIVCGALIFFLWAYALGRASPTLVAASVAVNPVTASIFGLVLLGEGFSLRLLVGLAAVLAGIAVAAGMGQRRTIPIA